MAMSDEKMRVVICEPGMLARAAEIGTSLEDLQRAVGGLIEAAYPFEEEVAIVCNEEGKINGMPLNRSLKDADGRIYDIIAGPFFVCGLGEEDFCSLSDEQIGKYTDIFQKPEHFFRSGAGIEAVPYIPERNDIER